VRPLRKAAEIVTDGASGEKANLIDGHVVIGSIMGCGR
jgi:hypothetical protein